MVKADTQSEYKSHTLADWEPISGLVFERKEELILRGAIFFPLLILPILTKRSTLPPLKEKRIMPVF